MSTENYVYKKEVDWSLFNYGLSIPVSHQVIFKQIAGRFIERGESKPITLYLNGKSYQARLNNLKIDPKYGNHVDMVHIRYSGNSDIALALRGCFSLTNISIPNSVTTIGSAFTGCSSLKNIIIPDGIMSIDDYTFSGCSNLASINVPNSVISIGEEAFSDCNSLKIITVPAGVKSIGDLAFGYSFTNISIRFRGSKAQWDDVIKNNSEYIYYKNIVYNYFSVDADFKLSGTSFTYKQIMEFPSKIIHIDYISVSVCDLHGTEYDRIDSM